MLSLRACRGGGARDWHYCCAGVSAEGVDYEHLGSGQRPAKDPQLVYVALVELYQLDRAIFPAVIFR